MQLLRGAIRDLVLAVRRVDSHLVLALTKLENHYV